MTTSEKPRSSRFPTSHSFDEKDELINNFPLIVEEKKLYINKAILANVSPVFYAMFFSDFKESKDEEIIIGDVKYDDMKLLLTMIYGFGEIHGKHVEVLLELADRFDIQNIIRKCERPLMEFKDISDKQKLIYAERFRFYKLEKSVLNNLTMADIRKLAGDTSGFREGTLRRLLRKSIPFLHDPTVREQELEARARWAEGVVQVFQELRNEER